MLWCALDKKGIFSTAERIALLERFLAHFPVTRIDGLTADREFRGYRWLSDLIQHPIPFRIHIPNNTQTHHRQRNTQLPVIRLFAVQIGETRVLNRPRKRWGHTLYLVGTRATTGEPVIVMAPHAPHSALLDYRKRWQTECLFAAMKRRGFNLEDTPIVEPERLERLVAVLTLTMCWCNKVGEWVAQHKPIPIKKHPRRACSVIRLGLNTLRRLVLNATFHASELRRMIGLLFDKTAIPTVSYG